jgi:hypothetical protein
MGTGLNALSSSVRLIISNLLRDRVIHTCRSHRIGERDELSAPESTRPLGSGRNFSVPICMSFSISPVYVFGPGLSLVSLFATEGTLLSGPVRDSLREANAERSNSFSASSEGPKASQCMTSTSHITATRQ